MDATTTQGVTTVKLHDDKACPSVETCTYGNCESLRRLCDYLVAADDAHKAAQAEKDRAMRAYSAHFGV